MKSVTNYSLRQKYQFVGIFLFTLKNKLNVECLLFPCRCAERPTRPLEASEVLLSSLDHLGLDLWREVQDLQDLLHLLHLLHLHSHLNIKIFYYKRNPKSLFEINLKHFEHFVRIKENRFSRS